MTDKKLFEVVANDNLKRINELISNRLKYAGVTRANIENLVNICIYSRKTVIGNLEKIRVIYKPNSWKASFWECRCVKCGRPTFVRADNKLLTMDLVDQQCRCDIPVDHWVDIIPEDWYTKKKKATESRTKHRDFLVTRTELAELYKQQEGRCFLTGDPIGFNDRLTPRLTRAHSASLDRENSALGYVTGNVQFLTIPENVGKNIRRNKDMIEVAHKIVARHPRKQESLLVDTDSNIELSSASELQQMPPLNLCH